jgi:hypothetical protein
VQPNIPKPPLVLNHSSLEDSKEASKRLNASTIGTTSQRHTQTESDVGFRTSESAASFEIAHKRAPTTVIALGRKRRDSVTEARPPFNVKRSFVDFWKKKPLSGRIDTTQRRDLSCHRVAKDISKPQLQDAAIAQENSVVHIPLPIPELDPSSNITNSKSVECLISPRKTSDSNESLDSAPTSPPVNKDEGAAARSRSSTTGRKTMFRRQGTEAKGMEK